MPLTPNFTGSQSLAYNSIITLTDTSTGSDITITVRDIEIRLANGNWLDENGNESTTQVRISWAYADVSKALNVLSQATSPDITVRWLAGSTPVYEKTISFGFVLQDYVFMLGKLQNQSSNPGVIQDTNYYNSFIQFIVNLSNAENAITYADDIYSSQNALNKNQNFITNDGFYF